MHARLSLHSIGFTLITIVCGLLLETSVVFAGNYEIAFSGVLSECDQNCQQTDLGALQGTSFSGKLVFPDSIENAQTQYHYIGNIPSISNQSFYTFALEDAYFTLDSDIDGFDLDGSTAPTFWLNDCLESESFCAPKDTFMWAFASTSTHSFYFSMNRVDFPLLAPSSTTPPFSAIALKMPSQAMLAEAAKFAYFDIEPLDNSASVHVDASFFPGPYMDVDFIYKPSSQKIPFAPTVALIPLFLIIILVMRKYLPK